MKIKKTDEGFTLIELLTVIAIIGILSSLLIPAVTGGIQKAQSVNCKSNLGQMGKAIQGFMSDNDDYFPPGKLPAGVDPRNHGLWASMIAYYPGGPEIGHMQGRGNLSKYIGKDMGGGTKWQLVKSMTCPTTLKVMRKQLNDNQIRFFFGNHRVGEKWPYMDPWGSLAGSETPSDAVGPNRLPLKGAAVQAKNPDSFWAIQDADQLHPIINPGWTNFHYFMTFLAHDDYRNTLYFDWHVGTEKPVF